ncbi:ribonuclease P protein component [Monaibacterium marinum]|uniref:Ribonuclease P protein component n=1 Tax=Pontivivens marinum TaxID=1690039 RepID=A0A2C9CMR8_9RHOB|nr:ribonuclease P protein component [Monaibacterium marinum]
MISPPDAAPNGSEHPAALSCSHETPTLSVIRQRSEFLKAARARRQATTGMVVQARKRAENEHSASAMRVGYTCSKKVGNAVARNRAKRRLREVARALLPELGHAGYDYVLIGRRAETADRDFADLLNDFRTALGKLHR